ncbi:MAG: hypothetical protein G8345_11845 [Magnetococcales bacterium]|nr:hypothetical protein [Magnetococcales bacterium]NGZ27564.1 hypothetical protein [Magnetococcales bacterium]
MNTLLKEIYEEVSKLPEADQTRLAQRWRRDLYQYQLPLKLVEKSNPEVCDLPRLDTRNWRFDRQEANAR